MARLPLRAALAGSLALVGLPTLAMPAAHWAPAALLLAGFTGAGALCVEIMTETGLQRMLDDEVFGRAYGLALPASIAGIAAGSLIAPALVSAFGRRRRCSRAARWSPAYCAVVWRSRPPGQAAARRRAGPVTCAAAATAVRHRPRHWPPRRRSARRRCVMPVFAPAGPVPGRPRHPRRSGGRSGR